MKNLILVLFYMSSSFAIAQSKASTTSTELSTVQPAIMDNVSISLDLSQSSNQFAEEQAEASRNTSLSFAVAKALANKNTLAVSAAVTHANTGFDDTLLSDTTVSYSLKAKELDRDNSVTYSVKVLLPTSKNSIEQTKLITALSASASLASKKQVFNKPLSLTTSIDALKYTHKFQLDPDGEALMDYRVRATGSAGVEVTTKVSFGVTAYYQAGETYQNTLKAVFMIGEELSYTPKKDGTSYYLAHTNDGNALGPNGVDSEIKAFDSTSSVFSAGVRATF